MPSLAMLYASVNNFEGLASLAKARIEQNPDDYRAPMWLADALVRQNRRQEAREILDAFVARLEALPDRHVEYVRACALMSQLAGDAVVAASQEGDGAPLPPTCLDWLDRAVEYDPRSAEALVQRARYRRQMAAAEGTGEEDRSELLALARKDLESAAALGTDNPRVIYVLASEWLAHGDPVRAAAALQAMDELPPETITQHFFDISDWKVGRFLFAHQLLMRRAAVEEAAGLADETLAALDPQERAHRYRVLPLAIQTYVTAGRIAQARECLDEYLLLVTDQPLEAGAARGIAALRALVEVAENRPYSGIELLEPIAGSDPDDPQMLRLLARAYSQAGQASRAVEALEQYRRIDPQNRQVARDLARQYAAAGDFERAFNAARQAESLDPADVDLRLLRIGAAISRAIGRGGSPDVPSLEALSAELDELRSHYPDRVGIRIFQPIIASAQAEMLLVRHYVAAGRPEDALAVCEEAGKRHRNSAEPWLIRSDLHRMREDYDAARQSLKQALPTLTDSQVRPLLFRRLALLELTHGDRTAGLNLLKTLTADPQEITARLLLLSSREIREDPDTAARLIDELRQAEGQGGLWWRLHQASLWLESGDWTARQQEITDLLQYCIRMDPAWPAPVLLLASMYEQQRASKQVEDLYRQGLRGNPAAGEIAERLLNLLVGQGRFPDAESVLRQIQSPRVAADWRVRIAIGAGDFSRAIDGLRLRVSNDRTDAGSRIELARLLHQETGDAAQAMAYLDEAQAIAPESRQVAAVRASILRSEGKAGEARKVLDDYVSRYGTFESYWMRAVYLVEGGQVEAAERDYRRLTTFEDRAIAGYELLGTFYASLGRLDQAVAAVEEGLAADPEAHRLRRSLMRLLLSRGQGQDRERALAVVAELEELQPQDPELMMVHALQALEAPTPQLLASARERLENIVKREPAAINAHLMLIELAARQQDFRAACDYAIRALQDNPQNAALLLARARAELALGYAPMAFRLALQAAKVAADPTEALGLLAESAVISREPAMLQEARAQLDSAVVGSPSSETLLIARAHLLSALGQPKLAIPDLDIYCEGEGGASIRALVTLVDLYRLSGDPQRAAARLERARQIDSTSQAVVHAGLLLLVAQDRLQDLVGISLAYRQAADQNLATLLRAAAMLAGMDMLQLRQEGLQLFEHAVSLSPSSLEARLGLAGTLYQMGKAERAKIAYGELLKQHPNDTRVINNLAWILHDHDSEYMAALELATRGVRLAPDDVHLRDTRGTILLKMEAQYDLAVSDFERILLLTPLDTRRQTKTLFKLGRVYTKAQDLAKAREYWSRALAADGDSGILTDSERSEIAAFIQN